MRIASGALLLAALALSGAGILWAHGAAASQVVVGPNDPAAAQMSRVIVRLRGRPEPSPPAMGRLQEQVEGLIRGLRAASSLSRGQVQDLLDRLEASGDAADPVELWLVNGFAVTVTPAGIEALEAHPAVVRVSPVREFSGPEPPLAAQSVSDSVYHVDRLGAPDMWSWGYRGQGVVVASLDTGVSLGHPDLARRWRGGSNSWFDPYLQHPGLPTDPNGHGTWTMGVVVGGSSLGSPVGVAPGAQWIAARIFDDRNWATTEAIHLALQWVLDPDGNPATPDAPEVVLNAWGLIGEGCDLEFQEDFQALRAAGILPVCAAGNAGPAPASGMSPATYPETLAVGASDVGDRVFYLSSRGPTDCGGATRAYPDVTAPGVDVWTTGTGGTYLPVSGTSIAAGEAAGSLALLLSAIPNLTPEQQAQALLLSARDAGAPGPDNEYGYGIMNVAAAYRLLTPGTDPSRLTHLPVAAKSSPPPRVYLPFLAAH